MEQTYNPGDACRRIARNHRLDLRHRSSRFVSRHRHLAAESLTARYVREGPLQPGQAVWVHLGRDNPPPPGLARAGAALSPILRQCLHNRGVTVASLREYLAPSTGGYDPSLLTGMDTAITRILRARQAKQLVVVYGDADVDGITATAVLVEALALAGVQAAPHIPNRLTDQFGLNRHALQSMVERGARLIITADCGISDAVEVAAFQRMGIDVIITDHHAPPPELPDAHALINPMQPGCAYPCKDLAGVGVAFKLAQGILRAIGAGAERAQSLLDLVAIGTIADMVPLVGENRSLVWQGLRVLSNTARPGVRILLDRAGPRDGDISANDVATRICPRINSAGRLGEDSLAYLLLTTTSYDDGRAHAELSCVRIAERQAVTKQALDDCRRHLREHPVPAGDPLVVVPIKTWAAVVSGIVAGKLAQESGKPVLVLRHEGDEVRGSLRGAPPDALLDALNANRDLLTRYGGHQQAAGFMMPPRNVEALADRLRDYLRPGLAGRSAAHRVEIDAELQLQQVNWQLLDQLRALEPCGIGNPQAVFLCRGLRVVESRVVGNDNLRVTVQSGGKKLTAMAYRRGDLADLLGRASDIDLVFSIEVNDWQDSRSLQLQIRDIGFDTPR